ncbi:MAG: AAA family ATPase, partial [Bacteroides sp.]|nr:AAA family ATPase [Bacteroides sp.]
MEQMRKLPIGIQTFAKLREENYLYVDKTALVYQLVSSGMPYFLSRPRRFGKSLLLSTFEAYFEGRKELFKGLAIEQLETEWERYPVLHLDLNAEKYDTCEALELMLSRTLSFWEERWGGDAAEATLSARFSGVIRRAYELTGKQVVV